MKMIRMMALIAMSTMFLAGCVAQLSQEDQAKLDAALSAADRAAVSAQKADSAATRAEAAATRAEAAAAAAEDSAAKAAKAFEMGLRK